MAYFSIYNLEKLFFRTVREVLGRLQEILIEALSHCNKTRNRLVGGKNDKILKYRLSLLTTITSITPETLQTNSKRRLTLTNSKLELKLPKPTSPNFNAEDALGYNSNFSSEDPHCDYRIQKVLVALIKFEAKKHTT